MESEAVSPDSLRKKGIALASILCIRLREILVKDIGIDTKASSFSLLCILDSLCG